MKLKELKVGETYKCILSGTTMLIVESQKQVGEEPTGEKDDNDRDIMRPTFEKVIAGKLCVMTDSKPQFLFNELHDGQMKEIEN